MHSNIDNLYKRLQEFGQLHKWHLKYAKFNRQIHQSLLSHCLNVSSLSNSILDYFDENQDLKVTPKIRTQAILVGFLHDAGKASDAYQQAVQDFLHGKKTEPLDFGHQKDEDIRPVINELRKYIEKDFLNEENPQAIWDEVIWCINNLGRHEDAGSISRSFKKAPSPDSLNVIEIVHLADAIMSVFTIEEAANIRSHGELTSKIFLTHSKVTTVRGVLTQFLHGAIEDQFVGNGYKPIQWFPNGTLFIGKSNKQLDIKQKDIISSIRHHIEHSLGTSNSKLARASFGSLQAQVIASPEFLFAGDDKVINAFWQYIFSQKFARVDLEKTDDLNEDKKRLFGLISNEIKDRDELTKRSYYARFLADFNLLIVLYAIRNEVIESSLKEERKEIEKEVDQKIESVLASLLQIDQGTIKTWPKIATQTRIAERIHIARSLLASPYYHDVNMWRNKFLHALKTCTIQMKDIWSKRIPSKYEEIASLLLSDIASPIEPTLLKRDIEDLNNKITEGKLGKGTPFCEKCGSVAQLEAQAKLFGKSQIYHDHIVAGSTVGIGNKIRVCKLCDFEAKLKYLLTEGGEYYFVFPQLALSHSEQTIWQNTVNELMYSQGRIPNILNLERWAAVILNDEISQMDKIASLTNSDKRLAKAIQNVAERSGFDDDLSLMVEPSVDVHSGEEVVAAIRNGTCKLSLSFENDVNETLAGLVPVYVSPNYLLLLTKRTLDDSEPELSKEIIRTFIRSILARLFFATVLDEHSMLTGNNAGYTTISSNPALQTLGDKLKAKQGWIPVSALDHALKKLAALVLIRSELARGEVDYGRASLLRLVKEDPGRVLVRMTSKGQRFSRDMLKYLDILYE